MKFSLTSCASKVDLYCGTSSRARGSSSIVIVGTEGFGRGNPKLGADAEATANCAVVGVLKVTKIKMVKGSVA